MYPESFPAIIFLNKMAQIQKLQNISGKKRQEEVKFPGPI